MGQIAAVSVGHRRRRAAARPRLPRGLARRGRLQRRRHRRAAPTSRSRARPRASRSTGRRWTSCWTLADARPRSSSSTLQRRRRSPVTAHACSAQRSTAEPQLLVATRLARTSSTSCATLLHLPDVELVSLDDVGVDGEAVEDADDLPRQRARSRPASTPACSGLPTLADDSGLEVDALGGGPGVRTRRYAGDRRDRRENNAKLLARAGRPAAGRGDGALSLRRWLPRPGDRRAAAAPSMTRSGTFEGRIALGAARRRRLWLRPDLRAGHRAVGGRTVGADGAHGEEPRLAPRARRPRDGDAAAGR